LKEKGIEVNVIIHVTCDDNFTRLEGSHGKGCSCDLSLGPCCCDADIQAAPSFEKLQDSSDELTDSKNESKVETSEKIAVTVTSKSSTEDPRVKFLPFGTFVSGRPDLLEIVYNLAEQAEGEMAVLACGPLGLSTGIRNTVARVSDDRAVHKGTGAEGIYLHVESFCW
jgi:hypothetical protein